MMQGTDSLLLRIYCVASDRSGDERLHEAIIDAARHDGMAGASVQKSKMGFSRGGHYYSDLLSETEIEQQPIVVEIIDSLEKVESFIPRLQEIVAGRRLITLEPVEVVHYEAEPKADTHD